MNKPAKTRSRAGRRAGQAGSRNRDAILAAARRHFARDGFKATTLRAIADEAGVTPAMLHYHFGNKEGLYFAVVEQVAEPMLHELGGMRELPGIEGLKAFFEIYMRTIAAHPEIPSLVMHDVLGSSGRIRSQFAQRFARRGREMMSMLIRRAQQDGDIDADMDVELGVISLLSLALFPFLAAPLIREVFGIEWDEQQLEKLIAQQRKVFLHGNLDGSKK